MTSQNLAASIVAASRNPSPQARAVAWTSASVTAWMREQVIAGGGNPDDVPDITPARFLRAPEVLRLCGLSISTLYRMTAVGAFPKPLRIDRASARHVTETVTK